MERDGETDLLLLAAGSSCFFLCLESAEAAALLPPLSWRPFCVRRAALDEGGDGEGDGEGEGEGDGEGEAEEDDDDGDGVRAGADDAAAEAACCLRAAEDCGSSFCFFTARCGVGSEADGEAGDSCFRFADGGVLRGVGLEDREAAGAEEEEETEAAGERPLRS